MGIGRDELDGLTRADLVRRATALGVAKAHVLTRHELVDEIVSATVGDDQERRAARGLFGRARDLVAHVVEKGLHLPDAAVRIRTQPPGPVPARAPNPIPTIALARVYAGQGHRQQARKVIDELLEADPSNQDALKLRERLDARSSPEVDEKVSEPEATGARTVDHEPAIPKRDFLRIKHEEGRIRIDWQVRPLSFARHRARAPGGRLTLRVVHSLVMDGEPSLRSDDRALDRLAGAVDVGVPEGALGTHVALGWLDSGLFRVLVTAGDDGGR